MLYLGSAISVVNYDRVHNSSYSSKHSKRWCSSAVPTYSKWNSDLDRNALLTPFVSFYFISRTLKLVTTLSQDLIQAFNFLTLDSSWICFGFPILFNVILFLCIGVNVGALCSTAKSWMKVKWSNSTTYHVRCITTSEPSLDFTISYTITHVMSPVCGICLH